MIGAGFDGEDIQSPGMINGDGKLELSQDFDDDVIDDEEVQVKTSAANNNQIALDISNDESFL